MNRQLSANPVREADGRETIIRSDQRWGNGPSEAVYPLTTRAGLSSIGVRSLSNDTVAFNGKAEMTYRLGRIIDHLHLSVSSVEDSKKFYKAVFASLGQSEAFRDGGDHFVIDELYVDTAEGMVSHVHLAFQARSREQVDAFHAAAIEAGGIDNGKPGLRSYHRQYYAAFVLDPDGNNIEAVCDAPSSRSTDAIEVERLG